MSGVVVLLVVLLVLWVILDGMRYSRYRRRYLRPGMGRPTVLYYPSSGDGPSGPGHPVLQDRQSHRAGRPPAEHSAGAASAAAGEACSAEAPSGVPEGPGAASAEGPSGAAAAVAAVLAEAPSAAAGGDAEALSAAGAGKRQI